jgi:hypothetical protein
VRISEREFHEAMARCSDTILNSAGNAMVCVAQRIAPLMDAREVRILIEESLMQMIADAAAEQKRLAASTRH